MYKLTLILFTLLYSSLAFSDCDLKTKRVDNCNFSNKNYERYNFSNKKLSNIEFKGTNLFGAIFNKTSLKNVDFSDANLFGAFFVESSLENVTFDGSDISSADFTGATVSDTSFLEATKEDTIFGKMKIEKPKVIKVKNCKLVIGKEYKLDWATFVLGLSLKGTAESDIFVVKSLCNWHPKSTFLLRGVSSHNGKEKLSINYNSCTFPVSVWTDDKKKKTYIEDSYRSTCLKGSYSSSSSSSPQYVMVTFDSVCGFALCSDKNLSISGGPGSFSPSFSGSDSGAIHKGYNGLAGTYNWSAQFDNYGCSGSFRLSGTKRNLTISSHKNCSTTYNEY